MSEITKIGAILLCLVMVTSCGNRPQLGKAGSGNHADSLQGMLAQVTALEPMEAGFFKVSGQDFGELIEIQGVSIETDVIFKPLELEMQVRDNQLIMKTMGNEGIIKLLTLPDFQLIKRKKTGSFSDPNSLLKRVVRISIMYPIRLPARDSIITGPISQTRSAWSMTWKQDSGRTWAGQP